MTGREFLAYNEQFGKRQVALQAEQRKSEPVRIGDIVQGVLADIERHQRPNTKNKTYKMEVSNATI